MSGAFALMVATRALAGGGGENMMLVVNASDEAAVRIAGAYQKIRNIPDGNILFITPTDINYGMQRLRTTNDTDLMNTYLNPIASAIRDRGLSSQIDYIGTLGLPTYTTTTKYGGNRDNISVNYRMMRLDQELAGGTLSTSTGQSQSSLTLNSNTAMHHSKIYTNYGNAQYYMSGAIGYTGQFGNTPSQVIANLQYTATGDGAKPRGTIYFEENDDVRSNTREYQWPGVQAALTARGISWVQERNVPGNTPQNRANVLGAVIGAAEYTTPNGSRYLPGSWADSLTSGGGDFSGYNQTKATSLIAAGAAASCGTVTEPYAIANKFTNASVHVFMADGSTIGEAFYKSVVSPYQQILIGDMLAQPNADLPVISMAEAPAAGQQVRGTMNISASAALNNSTLATGIKEMRLLVDGKTVLKNTGASANFDLNTLNLSDGRHELRIVAVNNAAAESQSEKIWSINVNNKGQTVSAGDGNLVAQDAQVLNVNVSASAGSGAAVSRVELRNMGRVMGKITSANGSINLDASKLAYGDNTIIPVAVMADGSEVAGQAINVTRTPIYIKGTTYTGPKTAGIKVEYFAGKGSTSIAKSDFSGAPSLTMQIDRSLLKYSGGTLQNNWLEWTALIDTHPSTLSIDKLALRMAASFDINASQAGEWAFELNRTNDSVRLMIDGKIILAYDNQTWDPPSLTDQALARIFLATGVHTFELLAANTTANDASWNPTTFDVGLLYQAPDGIWQVFDSTTAFVAVPEPAGLSLLAGGCMMMSLRKRRK